MTDDTDLTVTDDGQLQRWAFGRAANDAERDRAAAALAELARRERARAELASSEAAALAAAPPAESATLNEHPRDDDEPATESPIDPAITRRARRMLATGIAGVLTALLAAPFVATLLTLPDPDPLAIFEKPATALDEEWATRVEQNFLSVPTLGPRVVEAGDLTLVAFRSSTVPDGRSTEWDAYCLASTESDLVTGTPAPGSLMLNCAHPERFAHDGISWVLGGNSTGEGFTVVRWGPVGPPRVEQVESVETPTTPMSILDWMAYPNFVDDVASVLAVVHEPERLLMGPSPFFVIDENGSDEVELALYLLAPRSPSDEPEMCLAATARRSPTATGCRPLSEAVAEGLIVYAPAEEGGWNVTISPEGQPTVERTGVVLD